MTSTMGLNETETVQFEVKNNVATITLNRPQKLNALTPEMFQALSEAWRRVGDDKEIRVAIVTGEGEDAFCVGGDLNETIQPSPQDFSTFWQKDPNPVINRGMNLWKPVICAVNGYCFGGGMTMFLATDLRIAGENAEFGLQEPKRGILPGRGGTQRITKQIPRPLAMELLLTGDPIPADKAKDFGLVNEVVSPDEVLPTARSYAKRIASNAPLAVQAIKELALRSQNLPLEEGLRLEESFSKHLKGTEDASEGVSAFQDGREPNFRGH